MQSLRRHLTLSTSRERDHWEREPHRTRAENELNVRSLSRRSRAPSGDFSDLAPR